MVKTLRALAFWAVMTSALLWGATLGALLVKATADSPAIQDLLPYQLPGQPVPAGADCSWESWHYNGRYCQQGDVFFALDSRGLIEHASRSVHGLTVGDFIIAWGDPDGYTASSWSHSIMWGNRTLYVWDDEPFQPTNKASFLSYGLKPALSTRWRGFVNKDNR